MAEVAFLTKWAGQKNQKHRKIWEDTTSVTIEIHMFTLLHMMRYTLFKNIVTSIWPAKEKSIGISIRRYIEYPIARQYWLHIYTVMQCSLAPLWWFRGKLWNIKGSILWASISPQRQTSPSPSQTSLSTWSSSPPPSLLPQCFALCVTLHLWWPSDYH